MIVLNLLCRKVVQELGARANKPPPIVGEDILIYDATQLLEAEFDEVLTNAAELCVPVLFRNFATRFGPMGRGTKTSNINSYLEHQESRARPPPTCQIQGETIDAKHLDYRSFENWKWETFLIADRARMVLWLNGWY